MSVVSLNMLADLHIDKYAGGMQHGDIQDYRRSTIVKIRAICNELLRVDTLNARNEGDKSGHGLAIASYDLVVANANGVASVTLPEFCIQLPHNGGVHRVFPKDRRQGGFDFMRTYNPGVSAKTEVGNYPGYKFYWLEGNKICFRGAYTEPDEDMNVTVQIFVAAPATIGEGDPLPIAPEHQAEILRRLDLMRQPILPADKGNNNNPNG